MHLDSLRWLKNSFKFLWRYKLIPIPWLMRGGYWMLLYNDQQGLELLKDYEKHIRGFLEKYLRPGMLFIDAGANQGFYTLLARKLGARVVAFEPIPLSRRRLQRNLALNRLEESDAWLRISDRALGEVNRTDQPMYIVSGYESRASFASPPDEVPGHANILGFPLAGVPQASLDTWLAKGLWNDRTGKVDKARVDVIKIDVEGSELNALRGMKRILQIDRPVVILEVADVATRQFGYPAERLIAFMILQDYRPLGSLLKKDYYRETDIFVPEERYEELSGYAC